MSRHSHIPNEEFAHAAEHPGYEDLGFAKIDLDRKRRNGFAEVVFGEHKAVSQIVQIVRLLAERGENVLVTRIDPDPAGEVIAACPELKLEYDPLSRCLTSLLTKPAYLGKVAVVSAGTADHPVSEEAARVAEFFGLEVSRFYDVGVAGIHRLLDRIDAIRDNEVIICVAGMEGAIVSVLGGLVDKPLLAVPSGVGYGAGAGGIATLLAMLNSCASGVSVLNIGNGFGAAYMAATICRQIRLAEERLTQEKH